MVVVRYSRTKRTMAVWIVIIDGLDYLMRGIDREDNEEKVTEKYKTKNILLVWNDFLSNLSKKQKALFMLLYILIICALVSFVISVIYFGGYEIGKFIGYLTE